MFLVVGLGNPGARYVGTRHNAGFMALDSLALRVGAGPAKEQLGSLVSVADVGGQRAVLAWPQSFMNRSGGPVSALAGFYKVAVGDIVVVHDDLDLPLHDVRVKSGGGHGGHNGLRDILPQVGADFVRVRVGIGRPPAGVDVVEHVLAPWTAAESPGLPAALERAADAVLTVLRSGATAAMNLLNTRAPAGAPQSTHREAALSGRPGADPR